MIDRVRAALATLGVLPGTVTELTGGWDSMAFEADGWIVLAPRDAEVAAAHRRQARLLPWLAPLLRYAVPRPRLIAGLLVYRKVPGTPADAGTDWSRLPGMLRALHGADPARAAALCGRTPGIEGWLAYYRALRHRTSGIATTLSELTGRVDAAFADFLGGVWSQPAVLVHGDLGQNHLLTTGGTLTGMIDFGDATLGDPVIDFIGAYLTLGADRTAALAAAYGPRLAVHRLPHYAWLGALEAVHYGLRTGDGGEVAAGLAGLAARLPR